MEKTLNCMLVLFFTIIFLSISPSEQLQSSQAHTLLRIQLLLNYPSALSGWNNFSDFCNTEPNPSLTVVCYEESITQLHIIGNKGAPPLPRNFSIDSFITTLVKLPGLKVLTLVSLGLWGPLPGKIARLSSLEIMNISSNYFYGTIPREMSSLSGLQTLVLDDNSFSGQIPGWLDILSGLTVLSLRKNLFNGSLPSSLSNLENLRIIALSHNRFHGEVPDLSGLRNLQVLDLEDNAFGTDFPKLGNKLVSLVLRKNQFRAAVPSSVSSFYQLAQLDLSFNSFVGPFPASLFALPSITYMNIAGNKFTGMLFENQSCNDELKFVDLSSNLLSGSLPGCLQSNPRDKVVLYAGNCLVTPNNHQHPFSFCRNEALAVGILPRSKGQKQASKVALALGITGGIVGGIALLVLVFLLVRRFNVKSSTKTPSVRYISEDASTKYTSKLLSDASTYLHSLSCPLPFHFEVW